MKYSIKDFFTFTEEILNGKLNFLCSASCKESVSSSWFNGAFFIITNKVFKRITNNHRFSQLQQQMQITNTQKEEITMNIDLLYVEGNSEKLRRIHFTKATV